jgi:16S rRNA (guanine(966)-N(2))-methyltransferase RsmD
MADTSGSVLMRVIAGKYRSRKLVAPEGVATRPTTDRLRETLFNVVAPAMAGSVWLDLFAGSGAIGIEALSRGATRVYFLEQASRAAKVVRKNLESLGIPETGIKKDDASESAEVLERDCMAALRLLEARGVVCDFCFLDPPYRKMDDYELVLSFLADSALLRPTGLEPASIVIAEHDKHFDPGDAFGKLQRYRTLKQGDAVLSFYRLAG